MSALSHKHTILKVVIIGAEEGEGGGDTPKSMVSFQVYLAFGFPNAAFRVASQPARTNLTFLLLVVHGYNNIVSRVSP